MKNFDYEKKYHYFVKYFVIAFPLIFILVLSLIDSITYDSYIEHLSQLTYSLDATVNGWYYSIIDLLGLRSVLENGDVFSLILIYPLYVFWVYVFDLVLDIFVFVPKLAHKLMYKLGGN